MTVAVGGLALRTTRMVRPMPLVVPRPTLVTQTPVVGRVVPGSALVGLMTRTGLMAWATLIGLVPRAGLVSLVAWAGLVGLFALVAGAGSVAGPTLVGGLVGAGVLTVVVRRTGRLAGVARRTS